MQKIMGLRLGLHLKRNFEAFACPFMFASFRACRVLLLLPPGTVNLGMYWAH